MIKKILEISLYAFVLLASVNFLFLLFEFYIYSQIKEYLELSIGFPFKIYYQFQVSCCDSCYTLHHKFELFNLIYNYLFCWIIISLYFFLKQKQNPTHP